MLLFWLISMLALIALGLGFFVVRRNKKAILNVEKSETEHKRWVANRWANMTDEQREAEYRYCRGLRNIPAGERLKPRDRPDMPFFDLWQKNIKESILDDSIHSGIGVNRKLNK